MLVRCPKCQKKLKVRDEGIRDGGMKFRCPECSAVFLVRKPEPGISASSSGPEPPPPGVSAGGPVDSASDLSGFDTPASGDGGSGDEEHGSKPRLENPLSGWGGRESKANLTRSGVGDNAAAPGLNSYMPEEDPTPDKKVSEWEIDSLSPDGSGEVQAEAGFDMKGFAPETVVGDEDSEPAGEWEIDESMLSSGTLDELASTVSETDEASGDADDETPSPSEWAIDPVSVSVPEDVRNVGTEGVEQRRDTVNGSENEGGDASEQEMERARRLARTIMSDIALYNSRVVEDAIRSDTFFDVMGDEIREGMKLYNSRISPEVRATSDFYREAVEEYYQKRRRDL